MALRAGYFGLKRFEKNKLSVLAASMPADIGPDNPIASKSDISATVDLMKDTTGWIGGNECVNNAVSKAENGVTWTVNADKSISAYGQPTEGDAYIDVNSGANVSANGVAWICNGCPSGGANDKYYSQIRLINPDGTWYGARTDTGNGYQLSEAEVTANVKIQIRCVIPSGAPAIPQSSPIVFRPMIISPEQYALNPSYRPYHESVEDTISDVYGVMGENGAKNKLMLTLAILKANNTDGTWSGNAYTLNNVTFTVSTNDEGYVTEIDMNGTCSADWTNFWFTRGIPTKAGSYIYNGISGGDPETYRLVFEGGGINITSYGGDISVNVPSDIASTSTRLIIRKANYVADHVKAYPMLRDARDTNPNFVPYAMTNRELTEKVFEKGIITSSDDLNDIIKTGIYTITTSSTNAPESITYATLIVKYYTDGDVTQLIYKNDVIYSRKLGGSPASWGSWYKFTGTEVTPNRDIEEEPTKKATKKKVIKEEEE